MSLTPTREFRTVSYSALVACDAVAISTLLSAVLQDGFFYLDLTEGHDLSILKDAEDLTSTSQILFDLPTDEKMLYDTNKLGTQKNYGYKPIGRNTGVIEGKRDGHELFLVPRDVLFGLNQSGPLQAPAVLVREVDVLKRFAEEIHQVGLTILSSLGLSQGLGYLANRHRGEHSSTSAIALLRYPRVEECHEFAGHVPHTDVGSLTLLFCKQDGLQVMDSASGQWKSVQPRPGHAVINVGDSLCHLSRQTFKSAFHRVLPYTAGDQDARYSLIYFMRPEQEATFNDENQKVWKSNDWHNRKFEAFRQEKRAEVGKILDGRV